MIAPSASLSGSSRTGSAAARYERLLPGGVNSNVTGPFSSRTLSRHRRLGEPLEAGVLAREERGADVEDPVAGRELELRGGEVDRAGALVGGPQRRVGVERGEPRGLALQLLDRLAARVGLEEPQRDQRRDDAREHDPEKEQGRQAETQRPEHDRSLGLGRRLGGGRAVVRSGATL